MVTLLMMLVLTVGGHEIGGERYDRVDAPPTGYGDKGYSESAYGYEPRLTRVQGEVAVRAIEAKLGETVVLPPWGHDERKAYVFALADEPSVGFLIVVRPKEVRLKGFASRAARRRGVYARRSREVENAVYSLFRALTRPESGSGSK